MVNVNAIHPFYLCKVMMNKLIARDRSGIVIMSSNLAALPVSGFAPYSSSKVFTSYLA